MAIKPILFNTEMVRAILDGRKTVTRRIIKPQPKMSLCYTFAGSRKKDIGKWKYPSKTAYESWGGKYKRPESLTKDDLKMQWKPSYNAEDVLYVRETWSEWTDGYVYKAWNEPFPQAGQMPIMKWHPSIHMPKEAARIWLKVTDVRVERLQEMKDEDFEKEGLENFCKKCSALFSECDTCLNDDGIKEDFKELWNSTIKKSDIDTYGWGANPWVWVIEFERCEKPKG